jgi:hypothetical protein
MLPEIRQSDYLYVVPKFELDRNDVSNLAHELKGFHENFADCFHRTESRDNFYRYMTGQFSPLERKSIEPIAFAIEGGKVRAMQRFVSDAPWDEDKIMSKYRSLVNDDLGHPDGAIIFDESGFVKKGDDSIGVARQYCGTIGKVDNCQVGVFAAYTSAHGYALIDKRLYFIFPSNGSRMITVQDGKNAGCPPRSNFKRNPSWLLKCFEISRTRNIRPFDLYSPIQYTQPVRNSSKLLNRWWG